MPRVSVVIVNYNYARFLPSAIDSALAQDAAENEVIVVDDCSTDKSREVIAGYGDRIVPVLHPQNRGHAAAMNSGFRRAKGEIVIFLDSDDYLYPHAIRRIVENRTRAAAQYQYRLDLVDAEGRVLDMFPPKEMKMDSGDVSSALLQRGRYATTVTSGLAFSRAALDNIMPIDEGDFRMGADGYLATVAPLYGNVVTINEVLGAYRQHGGNHAQYAGYDSSRTAVAARARWRIYHDEMRYRALTAHAARMGKHLRAGAWQNDMWHLEERFASLLLSPDEHPQIGDRRQQLAKYGFIACRNLPMSWRRRTTLMLWWLIIGWAPGPIARPLLLWKLHARSRPRFVAKLAKAFRAATA